ncbi:MAG: hypothetical protein P4L10_02425 [Acidobacteriaceae bacterium]|nr:hypothetical protein [Acidobacteriaceae bacterium]
MLYDKTGQIVHRLAEGLTNLEIAQATPNHTVVKTDEGVFAIELAASRVQVLHPESSLESFGKHCDFFYDVLFSELQIRLLARIGFRTAWRLAFDTVEESINFISTLEVLNTAENDPFRIGSPISECTKRWQSDKLGINFSARIVDGELSAELPPEFGDDRNKMARVRGVIFDLDYYTVAPVDCGQWRPSEWIPITTRKLKKDMEALIEL